MSFRMICNWSCARSSKYAVARDAWADNFALARAAALACELARLLSTLRRICPHRSTVQSPLIPRLLVVCGWPKTVPKLDVPPVGPAPWLVPVTLRDREALKLTVGQ